MALTLQDKKELANIYSKCSLVPDLYKNNPANVFAAIDFAEKRNIDYMQVMQSTFLTHGKFTLTTTLAISLANQSGLLEGGIRYKKEGEGDNLQVTAFAKLKNGDDISYTVTMTMAKADGWTVKKSKDPNKIFINKYESLAAHMLMYRAAIFLIRTHIPEVLNGCYTKEEMEDVKAVESKENKQPIKNMELSEIQEIPATLEQLQSIIKNNNISDEIISKWCEKAKVSDISELDKEKITLLINKYNRENYVHN